MIGEWASTRRGTVTIPLGILPSAHALMNEPECLLVGLLDFSGITAGQSMFGAGDREKLMIDTEPAELLSHQGRLFVGHIGIFRAVYQQGRWILLGDVLYRQIWIELLRLLVRVPARNFLWLDSPLSAELIERAAVSLSVP